MDLAKQQLMLVVCRQIRREMERQLRHRDIRHIPSYKECVLELHEQVGDVALRIAVYPDAAWHDFFRCIARLMAMDKAGIIPVDAASSEGVRLFTNIALLTPTSVEESAH